MNVMEGRETKASNEETSVYDRLRDDIVHGRVKPHERLKVSELARRMGTSTNPVREALQRLTAEGLALAENRHRFVADFSFHEVEVIFDLRARMESYAAKLAATRITEPELDRLRAHVTAARRLLAAEGPVGRKLDFLVQEFNREANTLCSKADFTSLTEAGLELKTVIDQMREQAQNIE